MQVEDDATVNIFLVREEDEVDSMSQKECFSRHVYSTTEKTQFPMFMFPQVVQRHQLGEVG